MKESERKLLQLYQLIKGLTIGKNQDSLSIDSIWESAFRKGLYARISAFKRALVQLQERQLIETTDNFRVRVKEV